MKGPMTLTEELVARCERHEPDPGLQPGSRYFTDAEYEAAAATLIEQAPLGPLWVFAYGSLIWKPAIRHDRPSLRCGAWLASRILPAADALARLAGTTGVDDGPETRWAVQRNAAPHCR